MANSQPNEHWLRSHAPAALGAERPSREGVLRWVQVDPSGHWFWKVTAQGERHRRLDADGQAIWSWKPPARRARYIRGIFSVARLLLEYDRGPFPPRTRFRSMCGLPQCVNPAHWEPVARLPIYQLLPHAAGWRVHVIRTGLPVPRLTLLRVRVGALVHLVQFPAGFVSMVTTACGREVYPANLTIQPTGSLVTCVACVR